jgi:hypothetical protein
VKLSSSSGEVHRQGSDHTVPRRRTMTLLTSADAAVGDNTKGPEPTPARPAAKVWFAVDVEAHVGPTAEPTKQD